MYVFQNRAVGVCEVGMALIPLHADRDVLVGGGFPRLGGWHFAGAQ